MTPEQEICMLRQEIRTLEHKNTQLSIALSVLKVQYGALLDQFAPEKLKNHDSWQTLTP